MRHTAAVRRALRAAAADLPAGTDAVTVGVSGGGDSLALVAAACAEGFGVRAVVVDHGLQPGSAAVAARAAATCRDLGAEAEVVAVTVDGPGEGPARDARYRALGRAARGPLAVGHTADDDAEGVLLGLARGSGTTSLAGLAPVTVDHPAVAAGATLLWRPLLRVTREQTYGSCAELGLDPWRDPHNASPDVLRSRLRHEVMPLLREVLGEAVGANLARSARLLREDDDALRALTPTPGPGPLPVATLAGLPAALRRRTVRAWLRGRAGALTAAHLGAVDALVADWHGQGPVSVPWPSTMDAARRADLRLVVARRDADLVLDEQPRKRHV
ncbi:tRNA lysidine(34) synthetase TilS [Corynebacterium bovis]|uniref:tRNA(Ile)-lysidine synthase n=2 Tax=Corynebacterium bovis TaxID=36808 RepID=A0A8H9Y9Y6_9CORY|nr:tRNA lysidine(34) synthetase TilS [Corynebacterium bovis]MBB3115462.1 tRNA(Ile)-lysidine synthetase-like protein [Corynebacterium bovis DSM 20582 = CIP 54.80]WJY78267.1 tRNA(Ile)-lysidine synthase [Corynebacterium bovis DSM 20582 = CIP 54.80]